MNEHEEAQLASIWHTNFMNAMVAKSEYTKRWQRYYDAYHGEYFKNKNKPDYKSDLVSNYIFSIIETIRPIMLDNDPKFQAISRQPEGLSYSSDLQEVFNYEWDREKMNPKLYRELITTLITGTSIFFLPWDSEDKNVKAIPISPYNLYPDPLATCTHDAEYLIFGSYKHEGILQRKFPKHAKRLKGGDVNFTELVEDKDLDGARITNQILTLEIYVRDFSTDLIEEDGVTKAHAKYPNGRVLTICPELNLVLSDKPNIYKDKGFPFFLIKDYDIPGKFWGEGEVAQLLSPQHYMNEINNAIIDNAKRTANMPWIIDKTSGIPQGAITDRPGLILRKNPGSEVKRDAPPPLPAYIQNAVSELKGDMEQISGVFDTLKGNSETGVYTAQGILALQEAGQARIRLKVKLLEESLGELACAWYSRIKQFWKEDRFIRVSMQDGSYDVKKFLTSNLKYDYDIKITAGSTMAVNRGAMLDLMIRLAQTQMPDGQMLVDREAVVTFLPEEVKSSLIKRMQGENQNLAQMQQQMQQMEQGTQQMLQQNEANDKQTMSVVEQLVAAVEKLNQQILQVKNSHDSMVEKQKQDQVIESTKQQSYNEGYTDAEKLAQEGSPETGAPADNMNALPDDMMQGIGTLSDDELKLLIEENPDLVSLINQSN